MTLIHNVSRKERAFDAKSWVFLDGVEDIANFLKNEMPSLSAHEENSRNYGLRPDTHKCIIPNLYPIPARSIWKFDGHIFSPNNFNAYQRLESASTRSIIETASCYAKAIPGKKIAVEMSGGLDTALVAAMLSAANIQFKFISVFNNTYEFRTERTIQKYYLDLREDDIVVDGSSVKPFSYIDKTPIHLFPTTASLFSYRHEYMAQLCQSNGISSLFSGNGGDALLCPEISAHDTMPIHCMKWALDDGWADSYIFKPRCCSYVSGFAFYPIPQMLWSLRYGEAYDAQKLWARSFFRDYLPNYLTDYKYKAAYDGIYHNSLLEQQNLVLDVSDFAYSFTKDKKLSKAVIKDLIDRTCDHDHETMITLMARLSFSVWLYAFHRDGLL